MSAKRAGVMPDSDGCKFVKTLLVVRDFTEKPDRREELFAATSPLETLKAMLTLVRRGGLSILVTDVKKAHVHGKVQQDDGQHYVRAPPETYKDGLC